MDVILLTQFLTPCLPFLMQLGNKAAESAAEKLGEDTWEKAKAVWAKLRPKVEAKEAAAYVAAAPDDEDLKTALRIQLKKILEQDKALAEEIAQLMQEKAPLSSSETNITQTLTGSDSQTVGQVQGGSKVIRDVQGNVTM